MSTVIGEVEVAAIKEMAKLEAESGHKLTEREREMFKLGFIGGFSGGMKYTSDKFMEGVS